MCEPFRKSGIEALGDLPWGTHLCHFYNTKEELKEILVPYFKAGLENNEFCMWITSDPLGPEEAKAALAEAVPGFSAYLALGQIEFKSYEQWYTKEGRFEPERVLRGWVEKLDAAKKAGYAGMRITGNTFWLEKSDWESFQRYEQEVDSVIGKYEIQAICTYSLEKCGPNEIIDVVSSHKLALMKRNGRWESTENVERKRAEKRLLESEKKYRHLYESNQDGLVMTGMDGQILECNPAYREMLGYTMEEISSLTYQQLTPAKWQKFEERIVKDLILKQGYSDEYEKEYIRKDGTVFPISLRVWLIKDEHGKPSGMWAIVRDITERKRAEEAVKKAHSELEENIRGRTRELTVANSELKAEVAARKRANETMREQSRIMDAFFKHSLNPIVFLDKKFNFILVNEAYAASAQRNVRDFIGRNHFEFYPHEENERIFRSVLDSKKPHIAIAKPFVFPDHPEWGVTYWDWSLVPVLGHNGEVDFLVFSLKDVTERERAQEALRKSEERFRGLVETSSDWVWEVDANGTYTYASPKVRDILGYEPEEIIGKRPFDLMPPAEAERVRKVFAEIAAERKPLALLENTNIHKNGGLVVLETSGVPIFDSNGRFAGYRGMDRDVTVRKAAEQEKERMQSQLVQSQKMDTIGKLAGGIAHDFNNLLLIIKAIANLAQKDLPEDSPVLKYLDQIRVTSDRAVNLTRQLLTFSKKTPSVLSPLNMNHTMGDMLRILKRLIGENISIKTDLDPGVRSIMADKGSLEQLIMNLVLNSRDAMPEGGTVTISTSNVQIEQKECLCKSQCGPGEYVCLTVEDTGEGMEPEVIGRLFEPFFTTKGDKGIGLGLAVVLNIIKAHGACVDVTSEKGKGSKFKIYFPATEVAIRPEEAPVNKDEPRGHGERVLVIEDEKWLRKSVSLVLTRSGYKVFEAASAKEAADIFEKEGGDFHLIFSDLMLKDKSGLQLVEELLSGRPDIRVLLSSGYIDKNQHREKIAEKGYRFLQKPYEIPQLLQLIRELMRAPASQ